MMKVCSLTAAVLLLAATLISAQASRQEFTTLSPETQGAILSIMTKAPEFVKATKGTKKLVVCSMVQFTAKRGELKGKQIVQALHYDYDKGMTIRTTLDSQGKKVVRLEKLEAYPTPLAPSELRRAVKLASEHSPSFKSAMNKYKEDDRNVEAMVPVVSDRKSKLFGKRLVSVRVVPREHPEKSVAVTVNLTDGRIEK
jgi:hypothetical protein